MLTTVRTSNLRRGDVITEEVPEPRVLHVEAVVRSEIRYQGRPVEIVEIRCTDSSGRRVRRTATARDTWAVIR